MTDKTEKLPKPRREDETKNAAPSLEFVQAYGAMQQENEQLKQALAQARAEAERFSDSLGVILSAPRPTVNTILGPVEATAAGLNRIAVELYKAVQRIQELEASST